MLIDFISKRRSVKVAGVAVALSALVTGITVSGAFTGGEVEAASTKANKGVKNVIVMISDGMGYNHLTATDYYMGTKQAYESFPVRLGMSTYEYEQFAGVTNQYGESAYLMGYDPNLMWDDFHYSAHPFATDSASAATAMAGGVKTFNGAIGVDVMKNPVKLVTQHAEELGKATGVVTSVEWSHATPAGFVAHNVSRENYADIATEMIKSTATDVVMGAGNPEFDDSGAPAAKDPKYVGGAALWASLKAGNYAPNDADGDGVNDPWTLIQNKADFEALANGTLVLERVCGTAQAYTTLQQSRAGDAKADPFVVPLNANVPDLATMTRGALNVLGADQDGFLLMVEGGAVDWAAHGNQTGRMIEEQMDFNAAVDAVIEWVQQNSNWGETLLIVTADHETGMLWGPGSGIVDGVSKFTPIVNNGKGNVPGVSWSSSQHTNLLVPLFAKGDAARLLSNFARTSDPVRGSYIDNTNIADVIFSVMK
jgi:alkaline phosphatase